MRRCHQSEMKEPNYTSKLLFMNHATILESHSVWFIHVMVRIAFQQIQKIQFYPFNPTPSAQRQTFMHSDRDRRHPRQTDSRREGIVSPVHRWISFSQEDWNARCKHPPPPPPIPPHHPKAPDVCVPLQCAGVGDHWGRSDLAMQPATFNRSSLNLSLYLEVINQHCLLPLLSLNISITDSCTYTLIQAYTKCSLHESVCSRGS